MLQSVYGVLRKIASVEFRSPATENPPTYSTQGTPSAKPPKHVSPLKPKLLKKPGVKPSPVPEQPKPDYGPKPVKRPDTSDLSDDTKKLRLFNQLKSLTNKRQQILEDAEKKDIIPDTTKIDNDKTKIDLKVNKINTEQLRRKKRQQ